jgi:hypothetical protein
MFRRDRSLAVRFEGRRGCRSSRRFCCAPCRESWRSEEEIPTRVRDGGGEVTVGGKAPVINVGRGPTHENQ